jgi:hypothetical protein
MLALPLRNALTEMQHALKRAMFDPLASDRRFASVLNNYAAVGSLRRWWRLGQRSTGSVSRPGRVGHWTSSTVSTGGISFWW